MRLMPFFAYQAAVAALGARPAALSAIGFLAGLGEEGEAVAADPRHGGIDHGQHGGGGDRRIDRVAAGLQHLDAVRLAAGWEVAHMARRP